MTHPIYARGEGPPVIIMHELPGITQSVATFAERVVDRGFTAVLPSLVGSPRRSASRPYQAVCALQICLSSEFRKLAIGVSSPVVAWLRALASELSGEEHRPVGVVGMCLTGGFALAMAVDPFVAASVLAEPSLPLPFGGRRSRDLGMSSGDWAQVLARQDLTVLGVRFSRDWISPCSRFERLADELGPRFIRREILSGPDSEDGIPRGAHSVLTSGMLDWKPTHPGRRHVEAMIDEVLEYLEERLSRSAVTPPPD
jgi:dienelactone hydrolase